MRRSNVYVQGTMMMLRTQPKRPILPLHILPLGFLLLALATSMLLTSGHRGAVPPAGIALTSNMQTPLSPFGSGAAMRNLLF